MRLVELVRGFLWDLWRLPFLFQIVLIWMVGAAGWQWWKTRKQAEMVAASAAWPVYRGRVVSAQVSDRQKEGRHGSHFWEGLLTYSYTVPGHELEVGEHRKRFDDEEDAEAWARGVTDTFLEVRVDPADSKRSVWQETAVLVAPRADGDFFDSSRPVNMEFWGIKNLAAWVVFCGGCLGAFLALWIHVASLMGRPAVTPEKDGIAFFGMHFGAMACGFASTMIAAKGKGRDRRRAWVASAKQFATDVPLMKVLSAYVAGVFFIGWVKMGADDRAGHREWGTVMFSAVWLLFYLSSAVICWKELRGASLAEGR